MALLNSLHLHVFDRHWPKSFFAVVRYMRAHLHVCVYVMIATIKAIFVLRRARNLNAMYVFLVRFLPEIVGHIDVSFDRDVFSMQEYLLRSLSIVCYNTLWNYGTFCDKKSYIHFSTGLPPFLVLKNKQNETHLISSSNRIQFIILFLNNVTYI